MKTQFAWKVVEEKDGKFKSVIWHTPVMYSTTRWAKPHKENNPFLFVMKTRKQARKYVRTILWDRRLTQKLRIFKCKVRNMTFDRTSVDSAGVTYNMKKWHLPDGTMFADAVKLI